MKSTVSLVDGDCRSHAVVSAQRGRYLRLIDAEHALNLGIALGVSIDELCYLNQIHGEQGVCSWKLQLGKPGFY